MGGESWGGLELAEEVEVFVGAGEGELFVDQVVVAVEEEVAWWESGVAGNFLTYWIGIAFLSLWL